MKETLYTLTAYYRSETTYSSHANYRSYSYQFVGLSGLHSAMECALESAKALSNQYSKEYLYNMTVDRTVILR